MLRIGIAYSLKPDDRGADDGPDDRYEEFDRPETIEALAEAIRGDGHDVSLLGDGREFLTKMLADPPDFVFNFAEGQGVGRDREARVPAVCEMLGVPYSGSDPLTLAAALDKGIAKTLVAAAHGATVPIGLALPPDLDLAEAEHEIRDGLLPMAGGNVPLILKPTNEGSSKGIRGRSLAESPEAAARIFVKLAADYRQPILVEEYVAGPEVTVGILGNAAGARVIGTMAILPKVETEQFVYSLEVKRDWQNQVRYEAPASLDETTRNALSYAALDAFHSLGCRDVARLDYRINSRGTPVFIEANPLPGLAPGTSDLVILAEGYGIPHGDLVRKILRTALGRVGLGSRTA